MRPSVCDYSLLFLLPLLASLLPAQTTVAFLDQETKASSLSTTGGLILSLASGDATQSGTLTGTGTLAKTGAGTLTLSGPLNFSYGVTVAGGILNLDLSSGQTWSVADTVLGAGTTLRKSGAGTLTFGTNATFRSTGAATFDLADGSLLVSAGRILTLGPNGGTLTLTGSAPITVNGTLNASVGTVISGDVNLGNGGIGTINLDGATVYSGTGSISAATINGPATGKITTFVTSEGYPLFLSNLAWTGTVAISGNGGVNISTASMSASSATATLGDGSSLTIGGGNLQGNITGTGATASTHLGASILGGTTLSFSSSGSLQIAGTFTVNPSATLFFGAGSVLDPNIMISGLGTTVLGGAYVPSAAIITTTTIGGPSAGLTTTLETPRSFTTLTGWAGNLDIVGDGTAGIGTATIASGATAGATVGTTATLEIGSLGGGSSTATLTKSGAGLLALTGPGGYLGSLVLSEGTLHLDTSLSLQNATLNLNGGALSLGNLTALTLGGLAGSHGFVLQNDSSSALTLTLGNNNTGSSYSGALSGTGSLVKTGTGTVALTGANTHTGGTTVSAGTLQIGNGGTTGSLLGDIVNNGTLAFNRSDTLTYSGLISGTGSVTKQGSGSLTLSGNNTYTGGTTVNAGTLVAARSGEKGTFATGSIVTVNANGTLVVNGDSLGWGTGAARLVVNGGTVTSSSTVNVQTTLQDITMTGGRLTTSGTGRFLLNGTLTTLANNSTAVIDTRLELLPGWTSSVTTSLTVAAGSTASGIDLDISGIVHGTGPLIKNGAGTLRLSANNTYSGGTTLNAGLIQFSSLANFGSGAITLAGGGLRWATGTTTDISSRLAALGFSGATFDTNGNNVAFTTTLTGSGGFTKTGTGALTLSAINTYTGATSVDAGTLFVNGTLANTAVTVASRATLGGSGTISGLTTISTGAHLAAGNSPGTLTFTGGLTLADGAILDFDLGTANDLIRVSGGMLSSTGTITVNLFDSGGFTAGTYNLIDASGATLTSIDPTSFELGTIIAGYDYTFSQVGNQFLLTASAIPEPAAFASLAGLGVLALAALRRRRQ